MNTTGGLAGCIVAALAVGSLIGYLIYRLIWLGVGVLGVVGGYFLGTLLYSFALALMGWSSLWAMVLITIACSVAGGTAGKIFSRGTTQPVDSPRWVQRGREIRATREEHPHGGRR